MVAAVRVHKAGGPEVLTLDDIEALAHPILRHRLVPTFNAEAEGIDVDHIIDRILKAVPRGTPAKIL